MTAPTERPPFSPVVASVLSKMIADGHATTNALIDAWTARATRAEAELDAVRAGVTRLLSGRYMPTPAAIQHALWPDDETVDQFREGGERR